MPSGAFGSIGALSRLWSKPEHRLPLIALVVGLTVIITVSALIGVLTDSVASMAGYPAVFFLSFLGSVAMVVPVPGLLSVCTFSVTLSPFLIGLLAGLAETIGEISGYAVGYGGGSILEKRAFYPKLKRLMERRGMIVIFIVSLIPNVVFDIVGIAAGSVRYPIKRFLAVVWVGKTLKGIAVGYICFYGLKLPWVQQLLPWVD